MVLAGLQAVLSRPAFADGLEKKTIAVQYLSAFQRSDQKEAFRVRKPLLIPFQTSASWVLYQWQLPIFGTSTM